MTVVAASVVDKLQCKYCRLVLNIATSLEVFACACAHKYAYTLAS